MLSTCGAGVVFRGGDAQCSWRSTPCERSRVRGRSGCRRRGRSDGGVESQSMARGAAGCLANVFVHSGGNEWEGVLFGVVQQMRRCGQHLGRRRRSTDARGCGLVANYGISRANERHTAHVSRDQECHALVYRTGRYLDYDDAGVVDSKGWRIITITGAESVVFCGRRRTV